MPHIVIIGTLDTKKDEFMYLRERIASISQCLPLPTHITLIDCGREHVTNSAISISRSQLLEQYSEPGRHVPPRSRAEAIDEVIPCASKYIRDLEHRHKIHGIIGAGGSGGTSIVSAVMRDAVPLGLPKLIVSTVASGDTGPVVGETDMSLMYSVVDIAGTNRLLCEILSNAAGAIAGMAFSYEQRLARENPRTMTAGTQKTRIGITMFGVTTACVDTVRRHLESHHDAEVYVFHATGHGGKSMERLVEQGGLDAVLDLTTTEVCDLLGGGNMRAGPERFEAALKRGIPNVVSVGAADMVNFGPLETVPPCYKHRRLYRHNPNVTLMRTSDTECADVAMFMVDKLRRFTKDASMVEVWLPMGGVSSLSTPSGPFADSRADGALFETLKFGLKESGIRVVEDAREINDGGFAVDIAERLMSLVARTLGQ
ncbi:UPF0261 protein [Metarhizium anisopliae]|nr:UPF0261 protein [Metarhizium anisopliae]